MGLRSITMRYMSCFFFFQAEDGIRDLTVTGVQTCALPISNMEKGHAFRSLHAVEHYSATRQLWDTPIFESELFVVVPTVGALLEGWLLVVRSEERRVGKECRSRWSPYH